MDLVVGRLGSAPDGTLPVEDPRFGSLVCRRKAGYGRAAPTRPSYHTGSKVTTVPVWAAWMMVPLP